jgi:hypothetical protein
MNNHLCKAFLLCMCLSTGVRAAKIFIPMDAKGQVNHLKAYGIAFEAMRQGIKVDWLLNYKGGSYGLEDSKEMELLCKKRGITFTKLTNKAYAKIVKEVSASSFDGQVVVLEKAPKIAVYTPLNKEPWDDAVTLALTYAGIPFEKIYAEEVLNGDLDKYDWLHLHHEDFTGQYGKFYMSFGSAAWYINDKKTMEGLAAKHGYNKVSQMQLAVVKKIKDFVGAGGNMFAMCSATETFDIALAADGLDISAEPFDGDPADGGAQGKLDFSKTLAFKDFKIIDDAYSYGHSDIDNTFTRHVPENMDDFKLASPPGKMDVVPLMLCQDHIKTIHGFMGQTTAFRKETIKPGVLVMGERSLGDAVAKGQVKSYAARSDNEAKYIHGEYQKGSWTFLGGHDPEAYQHHVGEPPTDLSKFPTSAGYRLILNNVLFPAVKTTAVPTVVLNDGAHNAIATTAAPAVSPAKSVKIYPNPANDELLISIPGGKVELVTILNIAGKELLRQSYNASEVSVSVKGLPAGMYMVNVNGEYVGKVVKE